MQVNTKKSWIIVYGDGDDDGGNLPPEDGGGATPSLANLIKEHDLQDQLNTMIASNRKGLTQKNLEIVQQLEKLKSQHNTTTHEKQELQTQIEELQTQHLSKEEIANHNAEKANKEYATALEASGLESNKWKGLYENQTTQRSLLDAAVEGKAIRAQQIVSMLETMTSVVEVPDAAGRGTGTYKTVVKFSDVNEAGEKVTIDLSPTDAVNRMKELPKLYGNLFEGTSTGGLGADSNNTGGGNVSLRLADVTKDRESYAKWRKENPDLDMSKLK